MPATAFIGSGSSPSSGGTYSRSGTMTMAPPTPSMPATTAPASPSDVSVTAKTTLTRAALFQARVVGGEVGERVVRDRFEHDLHLGDRLVARAAPVCLEQQELVAQVDGGLAGDAGHELGGIALPVGAVTRRARRRRRAPALDGAAIGPRGPLRPV